MPQLPPKDEVLRVLLQHGSAFVHLDPRRPGVVVPAWLADQPQLVLQLGYDMPVPIPDLQWDARGWRATLSFQRTPFLCEVPWEAVYAIVGEDGRGMVWPDALPEELHAELRREVGELDGEPPGAPAGAEAPQGDRGKVVSLEAARRRRGASGPPRAAEASRTPPEPGSPEASPTEADGGEAEPPEEPPPRPGGRPRPPWLRVVK